MTKRDPFKYFHSSPEIIRLAVMMYVRLGDGELAGPVNADKEMEFALGRLNLGDVDVEETDGIALELLPLWLVRCPAVHCEAMSREGPSTSGNAAVETFFKTIKAEMIWRRS